MAIYTACKIFQKADSPWSQTDSGGAKQYYCQGGWTEVRVKSEN